MKCVLQRVASASVSVEGRSVAAIERGVLALVGIGEQATPEDAQYVARKLLNVRLWPGEDGKSWKRNVKEMDGAVLLVSQFTLYGSAAKGNKPVFRGSMAPKEASAVFDDFVAEVRKEWGGSDAESRVQCGEFGAMMQVALVNDGPVTLELESDYSSSNIKLQQQRKQQKNNQKQEKKAQ